MSGSFTKFIGFLAIYICFQGNTLRGATDSATNAPASVSTLRELVVLPLDDARKNLPVKFSATVLYHDAGWRVMFLEEAQWAMYMSSWDLRTQFEAGDLIEVSGTTSVANNLPEVYLPQFRFLRHGPLPKPLKTTIPNFHQNWGSWVELEGVVKSVGVNFGRLMLSLEQGGRRFQVTCLNPNAADDYFWLVDARLSVRGVNGSDKNAKPFMDQMFTPGFTHISILAPGNTNFMRLPPVTVKSLVARSANHPANTRVHLQGVVSDVRQNGVISLTDSTGTILVRIPNNAIPDTQEAVNVWGYPIFSQDQMGIEDGIMQAVQINTPPPRAVSPSSQGAGKNPIPTLITKVSDLRALAAGVAAQKIPIRIRGVLTYYDAEWKNVFFHDGVDGVYLTLENYPTNLIAGQWVEVTGKSDPGLYAPIVTDAAVRSLGTTNMPEPVSASLSELCTGAFDSDWVETEGVVCDVEARPPHLQLLVRSETGRFKVTVPNFNDPAPANLLGARVLLRGACGATLGRDKTKLVGINLHVPSLDPQFFKILNPSPGDVFSLPPIEIQNLYLYNPALMSGKPVRISGRVTLIENSLDFYLQDETASLQVHLLRPEALRMGDVVDVFGFPASINGNISFADARLRVLHSGPPVVPVEIDNMEKILFTHAYDNRLIRLKGRLLESVLPNERPQLMLENGASMFIATVGQTGPDKPLPTLQPGSVLEVTGVCIMQPGEERKPNSFRLLMRNAGDVRVVSSPPWWTPRHTFLILVLLMAVAGAAMGWVWLLRRSVLEKTVQIKQRMSQEAALESRYRELFENANDLFLTLDLQGRCTSINRAAEGFFGYSRQEALGMSLTDVVVPEQCDMVRDRLQTLLNGRTPETIELKVIQKDKKNAILQINARVFCKDGQPAGFQAIGRDITERTQIAEALQRERNLLRILIDHMPDAVFVKDAQERFLVTNRAYGRMRGNDTADAFIGKNVFDLFPAELAGRFHHDDAMILREEKSFHDHEEQSIDAQGHTRWLSTTKVALKDGQNRVIGLVGISRDITDYREKEQQLRQLSIAVEQSPVSIVITDTQGNIDYVNPKFTAQTGHSLDSIHGKNMRVLRPDSSQESVHLNLWTTLCAGNEWKGELQNRKADGQLFWESAHISPIKNDAGVATHFLGIYEDITERRSLEAQLRQAQKMESVGQLAAGVAHDFNNLLTVIQGHAELLDSAPACTPESRESLGQIRASAKRAADLTRQLLLFSRKQAMQPQALDLAHLIGDLGRMLQRLLGEPVEMRTLCDNGSALVYADPGMVEQIIVNLCVNARDAMPNGGRLSLETKGVEFPENAPLPHAEARAGRFVCLSVSDTGHGMDEQTLTRIFEPFFTTKPKGKGTGLGLATVYGIVKQHQGWVDVRSTPGTGTTFLIYFPVSEKAVKPDGANTTSGAVRGGSECILVVEDEDPLRLMVRLVLKRQGYRVVCASSGVEALALWKDCAHEVDLVLTDMVMPHGITGPQLAGRLLAEKPSLRIIYSSGYSVDLAEAGHNFQEGVNFLPKPYRPEDLIKIVRERLDRDPEKGKPDAA